MTLRDARPAVAGAQTGAPTQKALHITIFVTVSKTVTRRKEDREFKSLPLRFCRASPLRRGLARRGDSWRASSLPSPLRTSLLIVMIQSWAFDEEVHR
jgi:hypothetical protein